MSTDELHCNKIILALLIIYSSDYVLTENYLINCSSIFMAAISNRYFVGDVDSGSSSFTVEPSSAVIDDNPVAGTPFLYLTARIFRKQSVYEFQITQDGFYMIRFYLYPFSCTSMNLSDALFNVSASGFSLLSNFSVQTTTNPPVIKEFVIPIDVGKFMIRFTPQKSFFAFVNAVEAFLAPIDFNSDGVRQVTRAGLKGANNGLLARAFNIIHRINVGGSTITPSDDDPVWATWTPDDEYLFLPNSANNIEFDGTLNSMEATVYSAPHIVCKTANNLRLNHGRSSDFLNMTWRFDVNKNSS